MISWMQRHNKYLVITIWIATIAFIGAGAVGWGSMHFGQRAGSIAKIGDVTVSKLKYQFTYNNFYSEYAQKLGKDFIYCCNTGVLVMASFLVYSIDMLKR